MIDESVIVEEMNGIINNKSRNGNFNSSTISALMSIGKRPMTKEELAARPKKGKGSQTTQVADYSVMGPDAMTYIQECNYERRLGRCLENESNARPLTWGKLVEKRVNGIIGIEYKLCSDITISHPSINCWSGTPDAIKFDEGNTVADIKSPLTLKSFCQLVQPIYLGLIGIEAIKHIRENHKDGEKYYWQLVSNAILTDSEFAELIVYVPYKSELSEIQQMAAPSMDVPKAWNWIYYADQNELPYLPDDGHYKNINVIRFIVPQDDKDALTKRVKEAMFHLIASK